MLASRGTVVGISGAEAVTPSLRESEWGEGVDATVSAIKFYCSPSSLECCTQLLVADGPWRRPYQHLHSLPWSIPSFDYGMFLVSAASTPHQMVRGTTRRLLVQIAGAQNQKAKANSAKT